MKKNQPLNKAIGSFNYNHYHFFTIAAKYFPSNLRKKGDKSKLTNKQKLLRVGWDDQIPGDLVRGFLLDSPLSFPGTALGVSLVPEGLQRKGKREAGK